MNNLFSNIFKSKQIFAEGLHVSLYSIVGNLDEEKTDRIARWFTSKYHIPSAIVRYNGNPSLAVATDEITPPELEDENDNVRLSLVSNDHTLSFKNDRERQAVENLVYRAIEQHLRKEFKDKIWLRYRSSRTYCERDPLMIDKTSGVQIFSCFNIFCEFMNSGAIGVSIDSTSTLVDIRTLLDWYNSIGEQDFHSKFSNSWVLLTDERDERRTRYFVGIKKGYDIDSPLIRTFRFSESDQTVRNKYHDKNGITGKKLLNEEPVAEVKLYKEHDEVEYVPLSCLQYTPDLDEIKDEFDEIPFSEDIYISPEDRFHKIQRYLAYLQNIEFGRYKEKISLSFVDTPSPASGEFELPPLRFRSPEPIYQPKNMGEKLKYIKIKYLRKIGYYRKPDLDKIILIHRKSFASEDVNQLKNNLLKNFKDYNLNFTKDNFDVVSNLTNVEDLRSLVKKLDEDSLVGIIPLVNDRDLDYKEVKEVLNENHIPSQAVREDTIRGLAVESSRYKGVIQNLVAGIVTKGNGIPWILANKLSHSMFIGVDSGGPENKRAWATAYVFDEYGEKIHVTNPRYYAKEGIPKDDFKKLVLDATNRKLSENARTHRLDGITIHRDGFLTNSEKYGLEAALNTLKLENKVSENFSCMAVNIKKSANYRLFSDAKGHIMNPRMGSYYVIDSKRAFISTTGEPLLSKPTSKPLLVEVVSIHGKFNIIDALKDIFYLSELNWGSPTSAIKLPVTTYYADKMVDFADYDARPNYLPV